MNDRALEFIICDCALRWRKLYTSRTVHLELVELERRIILTVHDQPKITQVTLADCLEQEPQSLTRILDRLEAKKLIQKTTAPNDRRAKCLSLTRAGKTLYKKIMTIANNLRPEILSGISQADMTLFSKVLTKIKDNMDTSCPKL